MLRLKYLRMGSDIPVQGAARPRLPTGTPGCFFWLPGVHARIASLVIRRLITPLGVMR